MSATAPHALCGQPDTVVDYSSVPEWHRAWITEHAINRASQAYLEFACGSAAFDYASWAAAGISVIHDIDTALAGFEDDQITREAQTLGAEAFIRSFANLMRLHICEGCA